MSIVLVAIGFANGVECPHAGQFLKSFDFEAHGGIGYGEFTSDISKAKKFRNVVDALDFYRTVPKCRPWRDDGQPNRPLTALTIEVKNHS